MWFSQQIDGVRTWHNLHTTAQAEAISRIVEIRQGSALQRGSLKAAIAAVADHWQNQKTRRGCQWVIKNIITRIGNLDVSAVSPEKATAIYRAWQKETSEASAQSYLRTASSVWKQFAARGYCVLNPWDGIARTKSARTRGADFVAATVRDKMIKAASEPLLTCLLLGFYAGLRRLEIAEARRDWVDFKAGCLRVRPAVNPPRLRPGERPFRIKDRSERIIPLHPVLLRHLRKACKGLGPLDFLVCPKVKHGKSDYRYDFRVPMAALCADLKIENFSAHVMRRTFASLLVQAGVSLTKVSLWLGDDYRVTVEHYAHLSPSDSDIASI